ncbi:MAG: SGNH/GDSL hydrolase family protein [Eubacteriales bacterium]
MKSFKRSFAALLVLAAILTGILAGCGNSDGNEVTTTTGETTVTTTETTPAATTPVEPLPTEPEKVSLEGKTIVWLGSSVTYGSANGGVSMVDYLRDSTGCICWKYAVSGTTLVDSDSTSYVSRMKSIRTHPSTADYFICQLSTNDATQNKPLGEISDSYDMDDFDTQTVCGAIEYIIAYIKAKYDCPIAFYTGPRYNSAAYQKMVDALLEIQEKWGIYVIDFWNDPDFAAKSSVEQAQWLNKYMADDIHPNSLGYEEWWTPIFEEFISETIGK